MWWKKRKREDKHGNMNIKIRIREKIEIYSIENKGITERLENSNSKTKFSIS
jgi:hypothetical protein